MEDVDKWREKVGKAVIVEQFQETGMGLMVIKWLNAEIYRLSSRLADDDALDSDNVKRAGVRGELKAYRLIGDKMNMTKLQGKQARNTLEINQLADDDIDSRSPEQIATDAGL